MKLRCMQKNANVWEPCLSSWSFRTKLCKPNNKVYITEIREFKRIICDCRMLSSHKKQIWMQRLRPKTSYKLLWCRLKKNENALTTVSRLQKTNWKSTMSQWLKESANSELFRRKILKLKLCRLNWSQLTKKRKTRTESMRRIENWSPKSVPSNLAFKPRTNKLSLCRIGLPNWKTRFECRNLSSLLMAKSR